MGRKSDLERGSQGPGAWQKRRREACEEGGGKTLVKPSKFCTYKKTRPERA